MCGIAGIVLHQEFIKKAESKEDYYDIGSLLVNMAKAQQVRGQDSFGIGVFTEKLKDSYKFNIVHTKEESAIVEQTLESASIAGREYYLTNPVSKKAEYLVSEYKVERKGLERVSGRLFDLCAKENDIWIMSHGERLIILKDIGLVSGLAPTWFDMESNKKTLEYGSSNQWNYARYGTHGVSHVRISTGSEVNAKNAHPVCVGNLGDLAIVHNGEVSNADYLRKRLMDKGYTFVGLNDTEVIGTYIANQLIKGVSLEEAAAHFIEEATGYFTCLAATKQGMAFFKDRAATRPAAFGEHAPRDDDDLCFSAIATDFSALDIVGVNPKTISTLDSGEVKVFYTGISQSYDKLT